MGYADNALLFTGAVRMRRQYRLDGRLGVYDGQAWRRDEDEVGGNDWGVLFDVGEGEVCGCAVSFFNLHILNYAGRGDDESELMHSLSHAFGDAGNLEAGACGRGGDLIELLGELSVAEEEAQGGTKIIQLLGWSARDLRVAGCVEPGELAVEYEDLSRRRVIGPAH